MSDRKEFALYLSEDMKETLDELQKRPTQAIATALIFAMSEDLPAASAATGALAMVDRFF